jgi:hypothetical protein
MGFTMKIAKPRSTSMQGFLLCLAICSVSLNYALLTNKLFSPNALLIQLSQDQLQEALSDPVRLSRADAE